ncbi:MAG: ABC transporter permease [Anaerolineae bacterium]
MLPTAVCWVSTPPERSGRSSARRSERRWRSTSAHGARQGLRERSVIVRHVLRASLLPGVTVIALQAGFLLGGVVITESLFVRPGIGRVLLNATLRQDYPVVQGIVILGAAVYTSSTQPPTLLYHLLDPRV